MVNHPNRSLMKTEYTIIRPGDGAVERGSVDWPREPGYDKIKALIEPLIDGEPLEHVTVLHNGKKADMFVSEYGHMHLTTRGPLARNSRATDICRTAWMTRNPDCDRETLPTIVGVAILFDRLVWF